jgi:hypothetical protein
MLIYSGTSIPSSSDGMIAEQDFIMHIRRQHRLNAPRLIINVLRHLSDYSASSREPDAAERELKSIAQKMSGELFMMSNGDMFISLPAMNAKQSADLSENIRSLVEAGKPPEEKSVVVYQLPQDYTAARARANTYVESARASEVMGPVREAERALQEEEVRGPLTPYSLVQVEKLLENIDIKRYVRTQPVYRQDDVGVWTKHFIDFYISIGDLKRERFPRLNLSTPERLFLDLCCTLDRKLLVELAGHPDTWKDRTICLNLSAETVLSPAFAQFCHVLPNERRRNVSFEIHRSDLFVNFTTSRNAISVLKSEGFSVGIDGITPSILPFINFAMFDVDFYKINVTREKWPDLKDPSASAALQAMPRDKIIFSQCDHDESLREGQKLGIRYYQGWLIDDVASAIVT